MRTFKRVNSKSPSIAGVIATVAALTTAIPLSIILIATRGNEIDYFILNHGGFFGVLIIGLVVFLIVQRVRR